MRISSWPDGSSAIRLNQVLAANGRSLRRDPRTGYLLPLLESLGVPVESQLLVFSKTGVQRAYTSPRNPRALFFDHQMHAINLLTKVNRESRLTSSGSQASVSDGTLRRLINELADYLLFVSEAPPSAPLTPRASFAKRLESETPKDRQGRSCGQLDAVNRLLRYPCSYMLYSEAFDGLSPAVKEAVYRRMLDTLSRNDPHATRAGLTADDRRAILEILRDTKPDFPGQ